MVTFFTFYITSIIFYYDLNKKITKIFFFFTFPYKFFLLYITPIISYYHSKLFLFFYLQYEEKGCQMSSLQLTQV
jgi:hypothetical protein